MNDEIESILINVEKRVPAFIMRQLYSARVSVFSHFNMQNAFLTNCMLTKPLGDQQQDKQTGHEGNGRVPGDQTSCASLLPSRPCMTNLEI